ncbi:hypothetical protein D049_1038B, partial [Vibrio parahaemolyticus VPTS-2010]
PTPIGKIVINMQFKPFETIIQKTFSLIRTNKRSTIVSKSEQCCCRL